MGGNWIGLAKARTRKLKVFQTQFGFYDSVVAAPSQAAALSAWGTRQNLFGEGQARQTDDPQAIEAALAHPEVPLRRAVGSKDPFAVEPASLPSVPDAPKRAANPAAKARPAPKPEPAPDRSELDAAEVAVRKIDDARKREEAGLRRRQDELDEAVSAAQSAYVEARKKAEGAVAEARRAYRKLGGKD